MLEFSDGKLEKSVLFNAFRPERKEVDVIIRSAVEIQKFLFTKLDETTSFGSIMNVCAKLKKPISYLTMGQNVPDDIRLADIDFLVDLFVTKNRLFRDL